MNTRSFIKSITLLPALLAGTQAAPTDQVVWRALPRKWGKWMHATGNALPNVTHVGFNLYAPCHFIHILTKADAVCLSDARGIERTSWVWSIRDDEHNGPWLTRVSIFVKQSRPLVYWRLIAPPEYVWKQGDLQIIELS